MDSIMEFISPELLILIPVLYFVGLAIKNSATVADKFIPLSLLALWLISNVVLWSHVPLPLWTEALGVCWPPGFLSGL